MVKTQHQEPEHTQDLGPGTWDPHGQKGAGRWECGQQACMTCQGSISRDAKVPCTNSGTGSKALTPGSAYEREKFW